MVAWCTRNVCQDSSSFMRHQLFSNQTALWPLRWLFKTCCVKLVTYSELHTTGGQWMRSEAVANGYNCRCEALRARLQMRCLIRVQIKYRTRWDGTWVCAGMPCEETCMWWDWTWVLCDGTGMWCDGTGMHCAVLGQKLIMVWWDMHVVWWDTNVGWWDRDVVWYGVVGQGCGMIWFVGTGMWYDMAWWDRDVVWYSLMGQGCGTIRCGGTGMCCAGTRIRCDGTCMWCDGTYVWCDKT